MLTPTTPSNIWNLYDYYLNPSATYFAAKKANEPLHALYSYNDSTVFVVNSAYAATPALWVQADVFDVKGVSAWTASSTLAALGADATKLALTAPAAAAVATLLKATLPTPYFLRLTVRSGTSTGAVLSTNTYWLSTAMDVVQWSTTQWYTTGVSKWANMQGLRALPAVALVATPTINAGAGTASVVITASTPAVVAFFIHARLVDSSSNDVLPIIWTDNFVTLKGGESVTLGATFAPQAGSLSVVVECFNNLLGAGALPSISAP